MHPPAASLRAVPRAWPMVAALLVAALLLGGGAAHAEAPASAAPSNESKTASTRAEPASAIDANAVAAPSQAAPEKSPEVATPSASPKPVSAREAARARQAEALRKLGAADASTVRAGIDALREIGGTTAERELLMRTQAGLPPALTLAALDALVAWKSRRALPLIVELAQHRRALVRSHALGALGALERRGARSAQSLLVTALEDESPEVSAAAAKALSPIGTRSCVPALFAAYDRGVTAALPTIAELAGRESLDAVLERAPQGRIDSISLVLDRLLERKALSVGDQIKLAERLTALGTESARRYLLGWLDRIKLSGSVRVKQELFESLKALDAAPAPAPAPADPVVATKEQAR